MALHSNLQRRETGYYFRQAVPLSLVPIVGKKEIVRSLKTKNSIEAKERCKQLSCEVGRWFDIGHLKADTNSPILLNNLWEKENLMPNAAIQPTASITFSDLFERWANDNNLRTSEQRIQSSYYNEIKRVVDKFKTQIGDLPINEISGDHIRQLKAHYHQTGITSRTVQKYLTSIKTLILYAASNGWLSSDAIPKGAYSVTVATDTTNERSFPVDQLEKLFHSPYYTGYKSPTRKHEVGTRITKDAFYWAPLIGLCTGMRIEEIAQLAVADIKHDNGIDYIHITDERPYQKLKNAQSKRKIPIHYELINCGFISYVESTRSQGYDQLFPDLTPNRENKLSKNLSRNFGRYLRAIGIDDAGVVFHSFRHRFKDACRNASIEEPIHDRLTGHASGNRVSAGYGSGYNLTVLKQAINNISLDVDLTHLYDCLEYILPTRQTDTTAPTVSAAVLIPLSTAYEKLATAKYNQSQDTHDHSLMACNRRKLPRNGTLLIDPYRDDLLMRHPLFAESVRHPHTQNAPLQLCEQTNQLRSDLLKGLQSSIPYTLTNAITGEQAPLATIPWIAESDRVKIYFTDSWVDVWDSDTSCQSYKVLVDASAFQSWLHSMTA